MTAVILTRNDPVRLNACLWSIANQSFRPSRILIANSGAWMAHEVGSSIDIISEWIPVSVRRIRNDGPLGVVHARAIDAALDEAKPATALYWFFQDDAVASPFCLEALLDDLDVARGYPQYFANAVVPHVIYPDFVRMPNEWSEIPQESPYEYEAMPEGGLAHRGPCLGILMRWATTNDVAARLAATRMPMGIDDAIVRIAKPHFCPRGVVYHTRPERPRWDRIVSLMKSHVLPQLDAKPETP